MSPTQVSHPSLVDDVKAALSGTGLLPRRLEIEITETALLTDSSQVKRGLDQLKSLGVRLTMDDFGTGYSSLSHLASYPLDGLKIEKGFIAGFATRSENAQIISAMVELAKALNRCSTVEGIETYEQMRAAQMLGASFGQGVFFGGPLKAAIVPSVLSQPREQIVVVQ